MQELFTAVIPSIARDVDKIIKNSERLFRHVPVKSIYVVGPEDIRKVLNQSDGRLYFINENELVDVQRIRDIYQQRTGEPPSRAGWYIQQFIKLQFSRFTDDEYYLIWDSDTIPLKKVALVKNIPSPKNYTLTLRKNITSLILTR